MFKNIDRKKLKTLAWFLLFFGAASAGTVNIAIAWMFGEPFESPISLTIELGLLWVCVAAFFNLVVHVCCTRTEVEAAEKARGLR